MATIYVDGNCAAGSQYDPESRTQGSGSETSYTTLAAAITGASANDTIYVRDGTYTTTSTIDVSKALTIEGYSGDSMPDLYNSYQPTEHGDFQGITTSATCTLRGLKIRGNRSNDFNEGYGHVGVGLGALTTIENCEITEWLHCGIKGTDRIICRYSKIHGIGDSTDVFNDHAFYLPGVQGSGSESLMEYNHIYDITSAAFHLYSGDSTPSYNIIRHNICDMSNSQNGGPGYWGLLLGGAYNKVYGNVFYKPEVGITFYDGAKCHNNEVKNNIIDATGSSDLYVDPQGDETFSSNTVTYNYYGGSDPFGNVNSYTATEDYDSVSAPYNNIANVANPFSVASPTNWYDFDLGGSSLCIGAGTNLGESYDDALDPTDTTWPPSTVDQDTYGDWEIGAFVYAGENDLTANSSRNEIITRKS